MIFGQPPSIGLAEALDQPLLVPSCRETQKEHISLSLKGLEVFSVEFHEVHISNSQRQGTFPEAPLLLHEGHESQDSVRTWRRRRCKGLGQEWL